MPRACHNFTQRNSFGFLVGSSDCLGALVSDGCYPSLVSRVPITGSTERSPPCVQPPSFCEGTFYREGPLLVMDYTPPRAAGPLVAVVPPLSMLEAPVRKVHCKIQVGCCAV